VPATTTAAAKIDIFILEIPCILLCDLLSHSYLY
jgi:hypothetical protein